ncbi:hypothetical protein OF83DRAFT_1178620 [Amylostereum chailletii]|nr:hypothetical protein OF83DRAFT_1178620 [Amylostereum chailletii]
MLGRCVEIITMLSVGLIWPLAWGWQLTLVVFAIAPVFGIAMAVQTSLVSKYEYRNKHSHEEVAKGHHKVHSLVFPFSCGLWLTHLCYTVLNIRDIRVMGFESVFLQRFNTSVNSALRTIVRGTFVECCTYGVASSLIYLSEALLFYVGAVPVTNDTYTYLQMVQVLNLVIFPVSTPNLWPFVTQHIAQSIQATHDFNTILQLSPDPAESRGRLQPPVNNMVSFNNVASPTLNARTSPSSKIFGKSTVTALLQCMHKRLDHCRPVHHGPSNGHATMVSENTALISGGQAQHLQIAHALLRPSKILILDECTSVLNSVNQAAVMDTIFDSKIRCMPMTSLLK